MAAPLVINLTADTWTKVATAVYSGVLWVDNDDEIYYSNFVLTGGTAPTVFDGTERAIIGRNAQISHSEPIDVYVYRKNTNGDIMVVL